MIILSGCKSVFLDWDINILMSFHRSNKIISECPEKKDIAQQEAFRIENDAFDASSTRVSNPF